VNGNQPVVWITGATGLIGNYLIQTAGLYAPGFRIYAPDRASLDLTDPTALDRAFDAQRPQLILHCAAISKTPACDANRSLARKVNVEATGTLCQLSHDIPLVFCSTDLVFDGKKGNYVETDPPNPLSYYAETKVEAEQLVLKNLRHTVVRLSLNYGHSRGGDRSFNEEMLSALRKGVSCNLFVDEFRCPMPAFVTALALWEVALNGGGRLFHLGGSEKLSRYQIGELIVKKQPDFLSQLHPTSTKDYQGPPRPPDTSLDSSKIQKLLSFELPKFSEWILNESL
jgi:dTDP-4-dehydrorhamnose reductase